MHTDPVFHHGTGRDQGDVAMHQHRRFGSGIWVALLGGILAQTACHRTPADKNPHFTKMVTLELSQPAATRLGINDPEGVHWTVKYRFTKGKPGNCPRYTVQLYSNEGLLGLSFFEAIKPEGTFGGDMHHVSPESLKIRVVVMGVGGDYEEVSNTVSCQVH
jgi:hypothetical protein